MIPLEICRYEMFVHVNSCWGESWWAGYPYHKVNPNILVALPTKAVKDASILLPAEVRKGETFCQLNQVVPWRTTTGPEGMRKPTALLRGLITLPRQKFFCAFAGDCFCGWKTSSLSTGQKGDVLKPIRQGIGGPASQLS